MAGDVLAVTRLPSQRLVGGCCDQAPFTDEETEAQGFSDVVLKAAQPVSGRALRWGWEGLHRLTG